MIKLNFRNNIIIDVRQVESGGLTCDTDDFCISQSPIINDLLSISELRFLYISEFGLYC